MPKEKLILEVEDFTLLLAFLEWVACELPENVTIDGALKSNIKGYKIRWHRQAQLDEPSPEIERGKVIFRALFEAMTYHDREG